MMMTSGPHDGGSTSPVCISVFSSRRGSQEIAFNARDDKAQMGIKGEAGIEGSHHSDFDSASSH